LLRLGDCSARGRLAILRTGVLLAIVATLSARAAANQTSTLVSFDFGTFGTVQVDLFNDLTPLSVNNFLQNYVATNKYNNTMINRSVSPGVLPLGTAAGTPAPTFGVVQGGGSNADASDIATAAPINLEYSRANTRGTIGMARTTDPNSATSGWYFNTTDNTTAFSPNANSQGYAVFGWVVGTGMAAIDSIAAVPTFNYNGGFASLPLQNFTAADYGSSTSNPLAHIVVLNSVTVIKTHAAYQNPILSVDVNNDGSLSPQDLGIVLLDIATNGIHGVSGAFSGASYLDVNGDGLISPADVLAIVNAIQAQDAAQSVVASQGLTMTAGASIVPEPTSWALAGTGMLVVAGCAVHRRRKLARCG
jgi:peptidyl-prolyl cis-trans isomerase A (cyclophilin A)